MGEPKRTKEYLAVYDAWLRRGKPGRGPSPLKFGLMSGDLTNECAALEAELRPVGMTSWNYYQPEYYQPLLAIRRIADLLGIDPDEAAAEWHEWSQAHSGHSVSLMLLFSDYLHAEHEARENFSEYLFRNSREHRAGNRYPRIANPHPATYTSALLAKLNKK
jgi:hypothetical protein